MLQIKVLVSSGLSAFLRWLLSPLFLGKDGPDNLAPASPKYCYCLRPAASNVTVDSHAGGLANFPFHSESSTLCDSADCPEPLCR